jgi:hypothetical protein
MYIKREHFSYFESLYNGLDDDKRKRFMDILKKSGSKRMGVDVEKIHIVDDSIFDEKGFEPREFITRTMIKKAYKEAKEGK